MRIGIDATALPPQPVGAGNYIIQLIRALAGINANDEYVIFAQQRGHALISLPENESFEWIILEDRNPGSRLIWEQTLFPRLIRKSGVDLLHSLHYTRPVRLPCASVVTFHDMTFFLYPELHTRAKRLFFPLAIRASARQADALTAISESTRQDAIRVLGISPEKITATQLGVDPAFRPINDTAAMRKIAEKYDLPDRFILYVGLIEPRKNLPMLINAYKCLIDGGENYKLVLVGRYGWMYEDLLRQINNLDLGGMVHFTGYVSQEDLPLVYNLSSLFVYPTIYEGFGLPALEAMACGVPVITTDVSSLPEIVGEAGMLVPVNNVEALYGAMIEVLGDEDLCREMINKGIQRAAKFTWEQTAKLTLQVYQQVMQTG
ncbi:MAG: glycosyltransferase family 4 protein [Chloroflexi bacterium]|nr:glycosyltransferase family 4 protein [Chloroflexota bacterium]